MDKNQKALIGLIKLLERKEYAESFLNGDLYCNTANFFRNYNDSNNSIVKNDYREDVFEGSDYIINSDNVKLRVGVAKKSLEFYLTKNKNYKYMRFNKNVDYYSNMQCLYALYRYDKISRQNFVINSKALNLGKYIILIINPKEFLKRVRSSLKERNTYFKYGLVNYVNIDNYSGKWDLFKKPDIYKHQNEFRIIYNTKHDKPDILRIGDISDIAKVMSIDEFLDTEIQIINKYDINDVWDEFIIEDLIEY